MNYTLTAGNVTAVISSHGAELISLVKNQKEYIWQADPAYWKRSTPVLFPLVGSLKEKQFISHGATYSMGQHGFARDREFELIHQSDTAVTLRLTSDEASLAGFPYAFVLDITHTMTQDGIRTEWHVHNPGDETLHFSIGGHPAFNCALTGYSLKLYGLNAISYHLLNSDGTIGLKEYCLDTPDGILPITQKLFEKDALVMPHTTVRRVGLINEQNIEILHVTFDTSILGLWTPAGKNAPFVCIEPWYGTADWEDCDGIWEHRRFANVLTPGDSFTAGYSIHI